MLKPKHKPQPAVEEDDPDDLLSIDLDELHLEWTRQPKRFRRAAADVADAQDALRQAEADLEVAYAEAARDIRNSPQRYGIEVSSRTGAPTVDAVKESSVLHPAYQRALKRVNHLKHKVDLLNGLKTALDHRKKALEKLVDLRLANYFAEPSTKGRDAIVEDSKQAIRRRGQR